MKALTRKSNFELLRIVAMCMIILIHLSSAIDLKQHRHFSRKLESLRILTTFAAYNQNPASHGHT